MKSTLFNEKTIKRLCSNVKVTAKQKKTANEWLNLLESGSLKKERENYFKFAKYILEDILGYSIGDDLDFEKSNIEFTFKDVKGQTVLCIEAKGESKNLSMKQPGYGKEQETPFKQAWDNMGRIASIKYGICTNYKDFILIDKSKGYSKCHVFDFLNIKDDENKLKEFIAIFSKENIIDKGFLEKLYEKSVVEEREFTKQFYKLFHETRLMLIKEFQDNGVSREESIHYAQIFLNRLMFVFFAEDTGKLERRLFEDKVLDALKVNSIFSVHSKVISDVVISLFRDLDEGADVPRKIFGFNGGLFKEPIPPWAYFKDFRKKRYFDEIYQYSKLKKEIKLDERSQDILKKYQGNINPIILNLLYMASFDFNTEISVNILGHIFEQSISDLEELKEEKVLRRKREGVYYTPDYITDFICRNTIIPYLSGDGATSIDKLIDEYKNNVDELEEKFKDLKVLDPACGSGSFLIKAVEVLLEIYKEIQIVKQMEGEYTAKKSGAMKRWQKRGVKGDSQLTLFKWNEENEARKIIENNIFGVDINEESVEITKLSLFLKIARKNRKLIDLSKNIKCGNSLIDDDTVDVKAFDWEKEFPFKFNIVIGNPPYVRQERLGHYKKYFEKNYEVYNSASDIFAYFYEKNISLLKEDGLMSFISNTFSKTTASLELRSFLTSNVQFIRFADFTSLQLFDGATTYPIIMLLKKDFKEDNKFGYFKVKQENLDNLLAVQDKQSFLVNQRALDNENWTFESEDEKDLKSRIKTYPNIKSIFDRTFRGTITGLNKAFIVNSEKTREIISKIPETKEFFKPCLEGKDLKKWTVIDADKWLILFPKGWTKQVLGESATEENGWTYIKERYPPIAEHLEPFKVKAKQRYDKGDFWWELRACGYYNHFENEKIVWPNLQSSNKFSYGDKGFYINAPAVILPINDKSLLCVLNSKLAWFFFQDVCVVRSGGYIEVKPQYFEQFPYRKPENESAFTKIAGLIIDLNKEFYSKKQKFIRRLTENLKLVRVTKKLDTFYELEFKAFIKELSKQKIKLDLKQQDEWEDYFNDYKKELLDLKGQIEKTDDEINQMVYKLYGLNEKEIAIVERSLKK